jgi:hypothetical protein
MKALRSSRPLHRLGVARGRSLVRCCEKPDDPDVTARLDYSVFRLSLSCGVTLSLAIKLTNTFPWRGVMDIAVLICMGREPG